MIILRRNKKPRSLGRAYDQMIVEGYTFMGDDGLRATWRKKGHPEPSTFRGGWTSGRVSIVTLEGPNRHTGEVITDFNGRVYIK